MNVQLAHLLRIVTVPIEATVKHNGRLLGTTSSSGLMALWQQGDTITIEKAGAERGLLNRFLGEPAGEKIGTGIWRRIESFWDSLSPKTRSNE